MWKSACWPSGCICAVIFLVTLPVLQLTSTEFLVLVSFFLHFSLSSLPDTFCLQGVKAALVYYISKWVVTLQPTTSQTSGNFYPKSVIPNTKTPWSSWHWAGSVLHRFFYAGLKLSFKIGTGRNVSLLIGVIFMTPEDRETRFPLLCGVSGCWCICNRQTVKWTEDWSGSQCVFHVLMSCSSADSPCVPLQLDAIM